jgi:hypothetical protein
VYEHLKEKGHGIAPSTVSMDNIDDINNSTKNSKKKKSKLKIIQS